MSSWNITSNNDNMTLFHWRNCHYLTFQLFWEHLIFLQFQISHITQVPLIINQTRGSLINIIIQIILLTYTYEQWERCILNFCSFVSRKQRNTHVLKWSRTYQVHVYTRWFLALMLMAYWIIFVPTLRT